MNPEKVRITQTGVPVDPETPEVEVPVEEPQTSDIGPTPPPPIVGPRPDDR